jgi:aminopeptidase N
LAAARALARTAKDNPEARKALAAAWKREKTGPARREIVALLGDENETSRAALLEAAANPEAKVRVAAIEGLAKLKRDDATEAVFRAAWNNPKEAYGARKAALRGLVAWKVKDAEQLLDEALKVPADRHSIAATALELLLQTPGPKARELAALFSQYGQPRALRSEAVGAFGRLAKDDESLQDIVVTLVGDPDRSVRYRAWGVVRELKLKKAVPALKARVGTESVGFSNFAQRMLDETLEALKESETKTAGPGPGGGPQTIAGLDRQATDLEKKARELRNAIEALKKRPAQAGAASSERPAASN